MSSVLASLRHDSYWRVRAALGVGKVWIQRAELFQEDPGGGAEGWLIYWTVGVALGWGCQPDSAPVETWLDALGINRAAPNLTHPARGCNSKRRKAAPP